MSRWNASLDPILIGYHRRGLTDHEITVLMLDAGHPVSKQDVAHARRRLNLKENPAVGQVLIHDETRRFKDKPNPLSAARLWLGKRLEERPSGFWLDGRPASLTQIMQALNKIRVSMGIEQLNHNPAWRV